MAYKDLTFLLFAKDMSASRGFEKVAASGDAMSKGISGSMGMAGLAIAGLAISITAKSVKMAADFQSATMRLVTDAGESSKTIGKLSSGLLDISASTGTAATDIAKGMYLVSSSGYTMANGGLKVMKAAAEGAKIGGAELTTVADALTTVMKDYGLKAGLANATTSQLIETVSLGKTTMEDLAGSLHNVLPNAQALHISLQDVLGAMATMTQEGISADQASQNLNHTIVSMANPTNVQTQAMAAMGLNSTKVAAQLGKKGITGTLDGLVSAINTHIKGGLVLQKSFTNSELAAKSANTMFKSLPTTVQATASAFEKGSISQKTWTSAVKAMSGPNANLAKQWAATENKAKGFSNMLTSGSGTARTFTAQLARMTGGQVGLQVALHLTGIHGRDAADAVDKIGDAAKGAHKDVSDWSKTQSTFNQQQSQFSAEMGKLGIEIGSKLLPPLTDFTRNLIDGGHQWGNIFKSVGQWGHDMVGSLTDGWHQITGAFSNASTLLNGIGPHLVAGLAIGIANSWITVLTTIHNLVMQIPLVVRVALGIHSPSTVFREIGGYVGKGLEQGLLGSVSQIQSASNTMANSLISAFKSKDLSKSAEEAGLKTISSYTNKLQAESKKRASIVKSLATATDALSGMKSDKASTISSIRSSTMTAGDITQQPSSGNMIQNLQSLVGNTRRFKTDLQKLVRSGIDSNTLSELVGGWQSDPNTALTTADGLLANPMDLKQVVALQKQLSTASGSLANYAGGAEYNRGIASKSRQVASLKGREKVEDWRMQKTAARMVTQVAHETHVHINLTGHYAGTKADLAKTVTQAIKDAEKTGAISKNWNK